MQRQRKRQDEAAAAVAAASGGGLLPARSASGDENNSKTIRPLRGRTLLNLAISIPIFLGCMMLYSSRFLDSHAGDNGGASTVTLEQQEALRNKKKQQHKVDTVSKESGGVEYHIVFSTGCTLYQDWQSYVFFYQALAIRQPGTITRIVSGCEDENTEQQLQTIFDDQIRPMAPERFKLHFTPDYSKIKGDKPFLYFNKPFGMKHWLENALGHPDHPTNEHAIVILVDPDQLIMRPFADNDFSNTDWKFLEKGQEPYTRVEHGKPMGQLYGFGLQWLDKTNITQIVPNSPVEKLARNDARAGYSVGPPYVATARDMYTIVKYWCEFAIPVHNQYPFLLAEMYAYCLAAAHAQLPHQTAASFMISDIGAGNAEGWSYIDKMPNDEVCGGYKLEEVPNVLHFCQRYGMGRFFFGKRRLPKDFLSCESPMLAEPPHDLVDKYDYALFPPKNKKEWNKEQAKRNAFVTCYMIPAINAAAEYYKNNHCEDIQKANFKKELMLVDNTEFHV